MQYELGIIGAGNMAEAIARGVLRGGVFAASQLIAADLSPERRDLFRDQLGVPCIPNVATVAQSSRTLLLSVKPYQVKEVLAGAGAAMNPDALLISIAAGISTDTMASALGERHAWRIIRAMPNTPILAGEGMVAICAGRHASPHDLATARRIFQAAARVVEVAEGQMDAVTALSGSGPAYFYYLVEQMIDAGVQLGLTGEQAAILAKQTALGAARLLVDAADAPAELRRKVTTPDGTTAAAIATFDAAHMDQTIVAAVRAATRRSAEMGA